MAYMPLAELRRPVRKEGRSALPGIWTSTLQGKMLMASMWQTVRLTGALRVGTSLLTGH